VKLDELTEMHLLLREYGWEPEVMGESWRWSRSGWNFVFWTHTLQPIAEPSVSAYWTEASTGRIKREGEGARLRAGDRAQVTRDR
jgi:hypothetical protein